MTKTSNADCAQGLCRYDSASRPKYFNGMLLSDEHLSTEQRYHRHALKRLNRYLWGAGIVCGFKVTHHGGLCVRIHPGFALDCEGNAIESCSSLTLDLADVCKDKYGDSCTPSDAKAFEKCLILRYHEVAADPVPATGTGDDCGGTPQSQASRIREGFCLDLRDDCATESCRDEHGRLAAFLFDTVVYESVLPRQTEGGEDKAEKGGTEDACMKLTPECPACECEDCGICLARLTIDCAKHYVDIDGSCRRYIPTPRLLQSLTRAASERTSKDPVYALFRRQAAAWLRAPEPRVEKPSVKGRRAAPSGSDKDE